jgi:hypothetical protein
MARRIPLTKGKTALVDDEDYEYLAQWSWHAVGGRYAARSTRTEGGGKRMVYMHRAVLDARDDEEVDHHNNNKFDNRRENLRRSTRSQNGANKPKQSNGTSGFKGVTWNKANGNWNARIKTKHIGCYDTADDAARAYDRAAVEHWGAFAQLNFPKETA